MIYYIIRKIASNILLKLLPRIIIYSILARSSSRDNCSRKRTSFYWTDWPVCVQQTLSRILRQICNVTATTLAVITPQTCRGEPEPGEFLRETNANEMANRTRRVVIVCHGTAVVSPVHNVGTYRVMVTWLST